MKALLKWGLYLVSALLVLMAVLFIYVQNAWNRTFDVPLDETFQVVMTPEAVENGRYLVYGPAHCAYCHTAKELWPLLDDGEYVPLSGGYYWDFEIGRITSPNLTPDKATGIGSYSDAELKRALRANVSKKGRALFPLMDFHLMSDQDMHDIIAYLRSQPPVENEVPDNSFSLLGKAIMSFGIGPVDWGMHAPRYRPSEQNVIEYGGYLANNVTACMACHTMRDLKDGSYIGERFAGGFPMASSTPGMVYVTPNITPDPETGIMSGWTEDAFVDRFLAGRVYPDSPMPWAAYARMKEEDLRAIYAYLKNLEPIRNVTGPIYTEAK
jgi:mono/diheme cytochrome c family protein